jgi:hypothetical protein
VVFWQKQQHTTCDPSDRNSPFRCSRCFDRNFGERLGARRCWYCATDAFWWGPWGSLRGQLACEGCLSAYSNARLLHGGAAALYRARGGGGTRTRQQEVYYQIVDFKEYPKQYGYLATPLGNALAASVRRALAMFPAARQPAILAAAPSSDPARVHCATLVARASSSLTVEPRPHLISKTGGGRQKSRGLLGRRADDVRFAVNEDVTGRTVIVADDLITTGGTLHGCAAALMMSGAAAVFGAAIARVVNAPPQQWLSTFKSAQMIVASDSTRQLLPSGKYKELWVRFLCSRCHLIVKPPPLPLSTELAVHSLRCACGHAHALTAAIDDCALTLSLERRRPSELIFHAC